MLKRLALFAFFASGAAWSDLLAREKPVPKLAQTELHEPAVVAAWLKENASKADQAAAKEFFDLGTREKSEHRWSPAVKSFGESAIRYPSPRTLNEYADILLIFFSNIRAREKDIRAHAANDLTAVESVYRSAIAADSVLNTMTQHERQQTRENADCLAAYLRSRTGTATCKPLHKYGLIRKAPPER
ncbi:hypothetical protein LE190_14745 [Massilia oculi]|uniref:Uncharacterized protein n=1 Tax=Massilia hydrophila TaxID=3044279 RepID=A0ABS7YBV3_9BURK|nr:hypothetical protein [Massilia oculi]MCA1857175.1 hypothetical protein [Massilia oculi]